MTRRKFSGAGAGVLVGLIVAGCGSDGAPAGAGDAPRVEGGDALMPADPAGSTDAPTDADGMSTGDLLDDAAAPADVPDNAYCAAVAEWSPADEDFEAEVFERVNQHRAAGADCGAAGRFEPAAPLAPAAALRCAARQHSLDMFERDFFSHTNPDGDGPGQRLARAGYAGGGWGENIAWGQTSPAQVVEAWMASSGHCANIMNAGFTTIGVGFHPSNLWTTVFGN